MCEVRIIKKTTTTEQHKDSKVGKTYFRAEENRRKLSPKASTCKKSWKSGDSFLRGNLCPHL